MLSKRGDDINDLDLSELVSWEELTDTYNGAYKIDCTFTLALNTGEFLKGIQVVGPNYFLPDYLMEVETVGLPAPALRSDTIIFYKTSQYILTVIPN